MLFLVIGKPREGRDLPPKEGFLKLVKREWETVIRLRKDEKILDVYGFTDGSGGIIILEATSREVVMDMVGNLPLFKYADWEIKSMMNAYEGLEKAKQKLIGTS